MTTSGLKLPQRAPGFVYRKTTGGMQLYCDGLPLATLAKKFATPLYVYSATTIRQRLKAFDRAFSSNPHTICYSVKANSTLGILRLLAKMGCGFDVVSGGELERVLRVDRRAARKVVFSGVGKTADEIKAALKAGVLLFNVESESELQALAESAARLKKNARIALRVNPDVPAETHPYISTGLHKHKFGIPVPQARALYAKAAKTKYLQTAGVSVHIGSQITDVSPFTAAMERVADLVRELRSDGHPIQYVDAGGGLGIPYNSEDSADFADDVSAYANAVLKPLSGMKLHVLLEPGRSIIGPAGVLLTRVLYRKSNDGKKFLIVDGAMTELIRPALYQAHHDISPVISETADTEVCDVTGPVCESGDFFARDRSMPLVKEGDLLAILDAGAYGMVLSSNYNSRPRPAEVLVSGRSIRLLRRRETISDLMRTES